MAVAYHDLLVQIGPLMNSNPDVERGLKEGLNKFLSNVCISLVGKKNTDYYSVKAKAQLDKGDSHDLVYEHMVPKAKYIQDKCVECAKNGEIKSVEEIEAILSKYWRIATITKDEDKLLNKLNMPDDWDGSDIQARYRDKGIDLISVK